MRLIWQNEIGISYRVEVGRFNRCWPYSVLHLGWEVKTNVLRPVSLSRSKRIVTGSLEQMPRVVEGEDANVARAADLEAVDPAI